MAAVGPGLRRAGLLAGLLLPRLATGQVSPAGEPVVDGDEATEQQGEQPAPEASADESPDEVIYVDDQAVIRARQEVGLALRDMGYQRKRVRNGREVFVNEIPWKPQVVVDDDGWMVVRRAPPSVGKPDLPGIWSGPLGYLVCVANPTACVHIGGWVISERKLAWHKEAVVSYTHPTMERYEDALVDRAFGRRTGQEVPEALAALWERGTPIEGDGVMESYEERRMAIIALWTSRNCNEWGAAVREVVHDFMQYEVQESEHPFTADEVALANLARRCEEPLIIDGLED
jgi:hypothetical protein